MDVLVRELGVRRVAEDVGGRAQLVGQAPAGGALVQQLHAGILDAERRPSLAGAIGEIERQLHDDTADMPFRHQGQVGSADGDADGGPRQGHAVDPRAGIAALRLHEERRGSGFEGGA
ncbi:MAG: hypothetical protein K6T74_08070 [Geminicoccaceae bacterium]|nr:hypothetical protein [Geminicoccaceae bacterium]